MNQPEDAVPENVFYSDDGKVFFPCNLCKRIFKYQKSLQTHKLKAHLPEHQMDISSYSTQEETKIDLTGDGISDWENNPDYTEAHTTAYTSYNNPYLSSLKASDISNIKHQMTTLNIQKTNLNFQKRNPDYNRMGQGCPSTFFQNNREGIMYNTNQIMLPNHQPNLIANPNINIHKNRRRQIEITQNINLGHSAAFNVEDRSIFEGANIQHLQNNSLNINSSNYGHYQRMNSEDYGLNTIDDNYVENFEETGPGVQENYSVSNISGGNILEPYNFEENITNFEDDVIDLEDYTIDIEELKKRFEGGHDITFRPVKETLQSNVVQPNISKNKQGLAEKLNVISKKASGPLEVKNNTFLNTKNSSHIKESLSKSNLSINKRNLTTKKQNYESNTAASISNSNPDPATKQNLALNQERSVKETKLQLQNQSLEKPKDNQNPSYLVLNLAENRKDLHLVIENIVDEKLKEAGLLKNSSVRPNIAQKVAEILRDKYSSEGINLETDLDPQKASSSMNQIAIDPIFIENNPDLQLQELGLLKNKTIHSTSVSLQKAASGVKLHSSKSLVSLNQSKNSNDIVKIIENRSKTSRNSSFTLENMSKSLESRPNIENSCEVLENIPKALEKHSKPLENQSKFVRNCSWSSKSSGKNSDATIEKFTASRVLRSDLTKLDKPTSKRAVKSSFGSVENLTYAKKGEQSTRVESQSSPRKENSKSNNDTQILDTLIPKGSKPKLSLDSRGKTVITYDLEKSPEKCSQSLKDSLTPEIAESNYKNTEKSYSPRNKNCHLQNIHDLTLCDPDVKIETIELSDDEIDNSANIQNTSDEISNPHYSRYLTDDFPSYSRDTNFRGNSRTISMSSTNFDSDLENSRPGSVSTITSSQSIAERIQKFNQSQRAINFLKTKQVATTLPRTIESQLFQKPEGLVNPRITIGANGQPTITYDISKSNIPALISSLQGYMDNENHEENLDNPQQTLETVISGEKSFTASIANLQNHSDLQPRTIENARNKQTSTNKLSKHSLKQCLETDPKNPCFTKNSSNISSLNPLDNFSQNSSLISSEKSGKISSPISTKLCSDKTPIKKFYELKINERKTIKLMGEPKLVMGPNGIPIITVENGESHIIIDGDSGVRKSSGTSTKIKSVAKRPAYGHSKKLLRSSLRQSTTPVVNEESQNQQPSQRNLRTRELRSNKDNQKNTNLKKHQNRTKNSNLTTSDDNISYEDPNQTCDSGFEHEVTQSSTNCLKLKIRQLSINTTKKPYLTNEERNENMDEEEESEDSDEEEFVEEELEPLGNREVLGDQNNGEDCLQNEDNSSNFETLDECETSPEQPSKKLSKSTKDLDNPSFKIIPKKKNPLQMKFRRQISPLRIKMSRFSQKDLRRVRRQNSKSLISTPSGIPCNKIVLEQSKTITLENVFSEEDVYEFVDDESSDTTGPVSSRPPKKIKNKLGNMFKKRDLRRKKRLNQKAIINKQSLSDKTDGISDSVESVGTSIRKKLSHEETLHISTENSDFNAQKIVQKGPIYKSTKSTSENIVQISPSQVVKSKLSLEEEAANSKDIPMDSIDKCHNLETAKQISISDKSKQTEDPKLLRSRKVESLTPKKIQRQKEDTVTSQQNSALQVTSNTFLLDTKQVLTQNKLDETTDLESYAILSKSKNLRSTIENPPEQQILAENSENNINVPVLKSNESKNKSIAKSTKNEEISGLETGRVLHTTIGAKSKITTETFANSIQSQITPPNIEENTNILEPENINLNKNLSSNSQKIDKPSSPLKLKILDKNSEQFQDSVFEKAPLEETGSGETNIYKSPKVLRPRKSINSPLEVAKSPKSSSKNKYDTKEIKNVSKETTLIDEKSNEAIVETEKILRSKNKEKPESHEVNSQKTFPKNLKDLQHKEEIVEIETKSQKFTSTEQKQPEETISKKVISKKTPNLSSNSTKQKSNVVTNTAKTHKMSENIIEINEINTINPEDVDDLRKRTRRSLKFEDVHPLGQEKQKILPSNFLETNEHLKDSLMNAVQLQKAKASSNITNSDSLTNKDPMALQKSLENVNSDENKDPKLIEKLSSPSVFGSSLKRELKALIQDDTCKVTSVVKKTILETLGGEEKELDKNQPKTIRSSRIASLTQKSKIAPKNSVSSEEKASYNPVEISPLRVEPKENSPMNEKIVSAEISPPKEKFSDGIISKGKSTRTNSVESNIDDTLYNLSHEILNNLKKLDDDSILEQNFDFDLLTPTKITNTTKTVIARARQKSSDQSQSAVMNRSQKMQSTLRKSSTNSDYTLYGEENISENIKTRRSLSSLPENNDHQPMENSAKAQIGRQSLRSKTNKNDHQNSQMEDIDKNDDETSKIKNSPKLTRNSQTIQQKTYKESLQIDMEKSLEKSLDSSLEESLETVTETPKKSKVFSSTPKRILTSNKLDENLEILKISHENSKRNVDEYMTSINLRRQNQVLNHSTEQKTSRLNLVSLSDTTLSVYDFNEDEEEDSPKKITHSKQLKSIHILESPDSKTLKETQKANIKVVEDFETAVISRKTTKQVEKSLEKTAENKSKITKSIKITSQNTSLNNLDVISSIDDVELPSMRTTRNSLGKLKTQAITDSQQTKISVNQKVEGYQNTVCQIVVTADVHYSSNDEPKPGTKSINPKPPKNISENTKISTKLQNSTKPKKNIRKLYMKIEDLDAITIDKSARYQKFSNKLSPEVLNLKSTKLFNFGKNQKNLIRNQRLRTLKYSQKINPLLRKIATGKQKTTLSSTPKLEENAIIEEIGESEIVAEKRDKINSKSLKNEDKIGLSKPDENTQNLNANAFSSTKIEDFEETKSSKVSLDKRTSENSNKKTLRSFKTTNQNDKQSTCKNSTIFNTSPKQDLQLEVNSVETLEVPTQNQKETILIQAQKQSESTVKISEKSQVKRPNIQSVKKQLKSSQKSDLSSIIDGNSRSSKILRSSLNLSQETPTINEAEIKTNSLHKPQPKEENLDSTELKTKMLRSSLNLRKEAPDNNFAGSKTSLLQQSTKIEENLSSHDDFQTSKDIVSDTSVSSKSSKNIKHDISNTQVTLDSKITKPHADRQKKHIKPTTYDSKTNMKTAVKNKNIRNKSKTVLDNTMSETEKTTVEKPEDFDINKENIDEIKDNIGIIKKEIIVNDEEKSTTTINRAKNPRNSKRTAAKIEEKPKSRNDKQKNIIHSDITINQINRKITKFSRNLRARSQNRVNLIVAKKIKEENVEESEDKVDISLFSRTRSTSKPNDNMNTTVEKKLKEKNMKEEIDEIDSKTVELIADSDVFASSKLKLTKNKHAADKIIRQNNKIVKRLTKKTVKMGRNLRSNNTVLLKKFNTGNKKVLKHIGPFITRGKTTEGVKKAVIKKGDEKELMKRAQIQKFAQNDNALIGITQIDCTRIQNAQNRYAQSGNAAHIVGQIPVINDAQNVKAQRGNDAQIETNAQHLKHAQTAPIGVLDEIDLKDKIKHSPSRNTALIKVDLQNKVTVKRTKIKNDVKTIKNSVKTMRAKVFTRRKTRSWKFPNKAPITLKQPKVNFDNNTGANKNLTGSNKIRVPNRDNAAKPKESSNFEMNKTEESSLSLKRGIKRTKKLHIKQNNTNESSPPMKKRLRSDVQNNNTNTNVSTPKVEETPTKSMEKSPRCSKKSVKKELETNNAIEKENVEKELTIDLSSDSDDDYKPMKMKKVPSLKFRSPNSKSKEKRPKGVMKSIVKKELQKFQGKKKIKQEMELSKFKGETVELPTPIDIPKVDSIVIDNQHVCSRCGKVCKDFIEFEVHKKRHRIKILVDEEELEKYDYLVHKNQLKRCPLCQATLVALNRWNRHRYTHSKVRHFFCSICGKGFATKEFKKTHEARHIID